jgi:hypothetical protein
MERWLSEGWKSGALPAAAAGGQRLATKSAKVGGAFGLSSPADRSVQTQGLVAVRT